MGTLALTLVVGSPFILVAGAVAIDHLVVRFPRLRTWFPED